MNKEVGIIEETWRGSISIADLRSYWQHYLSDPQVLQLRRTVVDLRQAQIEFMGHELDDLIRRLVIPKLNGLDWKTAIVVGGPMQFGVSRQYQVFAERYSKDSIFRDYAEAKSWLMTQ